MKGRGTCRCPQSRAILQLCSKLWESWSKGQGERRCGSDALCRNFKWLGLAVGNACNERTAVEDIAATEFVGRESIKLEDCEAVEIGEDSLGLEGSTSGSVEAIATEFLGEKLDRFKDCTLVADCRLSFRSAIAKCR